MNEVLAVRTATTAFGNFIDPERELLDCPNWALMEVVIPEYERNGLGCALLKVVRYHFTDIGKFGAEGVSICADSSRGHMIYSDMAPRFVGCSHEEAQAEAPNEVLKSLYLLGLPVELVTLGALRYENFDSLNKLADFIKMYHRRASWIEAHPIEVAFANLEAFPAGADTHLLAQLGSYGSAFDWPRLIPE